MTAVTTAVLLAAAATGYVVAGPHRPAAQLQAATARSQTIATVSYQVTQLAVSGRYVYVVAGLNSRVTAYDRQTAKLVATIAVPGEPVALAVGPGGLVWVGYSPPGAAGSSGIWLLSPDLRQHSELSGLPANSIVPVSRTTALVPGQHGLLQVRLPAPGLPGQPTTARSRAPASARARRPGPGPGAACWLTASGSRSVLATATTAAWSSPESPA